MASNHSASPQPVNTMTQTKNRIRSLLKSQGLKRSDRGGWWNGTNRAWMRQEAEREDIPWREVLGDLLDTLELQERQLKRVTRGLDIRLEKLPGAWLLMTIPGVGPRTVEAVLAGRAAPAEQKPSMGCNIKWKAGNEPDYSG